MSTIKKVSNAVRKALIKKASTVITLTPKQDKLARELVSALHADKIAQAKYHTTHTDSYGAMADSIQKELQPNADKAIDYIAFENVRKKVIAELQLAPFSYKESSAKLIWQDFAKFLKDTREIVKPKSSSASATANAKNRAKYSGLSLAELAIAKANFVLADDLVSAVAVNKEIERVNKVSALKIKREDGKAITALKNKLKKWVGNMNENQVSTLAYLMANPTMFDTIRAQCTDDIIAKKNK